MVFTHLKPTVVVVHGDPPVELAVQPDPLHAGTWSDTKMIKIKLIVRSWSTWTAISVQWITGNDNFATEIFTFCCFASVEKTDVAGGLKFCDSLAFSSSYEGIFKDRRQTRRRYWECAKSFFLIVWKCQINNSSCSDFGRSIILDFHWGKHFRAVVNDDLNEKTKIIDLCFLANAQYWCRWMIVSQTFHPCRVSLGDSSSLCWTCLEKQPRTKTWVHPTDNLPHPPPLLLSLSPQGLLDWSLLEEVPTLWRPPSQTAPASRPELRSQGFPIWPPIGQTGLLSACLQSLQSVRPTLRVWLCSSLLLGDRITPQLRKAEVANEKKRVSLFLGDRITPPQIREAEVALELEEESVSPN